VAAREQAGWRHSSPGPAQGTHCLISMQSYCTYLTIVYCGSEASCLWVVAQMRVSSREDADYGKQPCGQLSPWRASGQLHVPPDLVRSGRVVAVPDAAPCSAGRLIHCEDLLATNWRLKEMPKNCQVLARQEIKRCQANNSSLHNAAEVLQ